ncbi:MAG TPA: hypothetical protein VGI65_02465 [Steroidobacteraceae bacterium]
MQKLAIATIILASAIAAHFVFGADTLDRPTGVDAKHWIQVGDRLGFVVEPMPYPMSTDRQVLIAKQPLRGYFSAKISGGWQRLSIENPGEFTH